MPPLKSTAGAATQPASAMDPPSACEVVLADMSPDVRTHALSALMEKVSRRTHALLDQARRDFAVRIPAADVRFDLRGRAAGQVRLTGAQSWQVRYNPSLLTRNPDDFVVQTVPHECAHLVAFAVYGRGIRPHGEEWQGVMRHFGAEPQRCHNFPVDHLPTRRLRLFPYHCTCRTHDLTSTRHRRVLAGQTYCCAACRGHLSPGPLPEILPRPPSRRD
jgi:SprT protein